MTKKNILFYIIGTIFLISLAIPTAIWLNEFYTNITDEIDSQKLSDYATFQTFIISFWGFTLNLILVWIAYKAFRNFGVKEQFHNKQLTLVTELATEISSTVLSNMIYRTTTDPNGKEHLIAIGYTLSFFELSLGFNYKDSNLICVRSNNIENTFPFLKYRNNPVLPSSIAKKLNKLYRPLQYSIAIPKDELPKDYVLLYSNNIVKEDPSKDWVYTYYENPTDFSADSIALRTSIVEWFKEYGAEDINI